MNTGNIDNERVAITVPEEVGLPDGMTIDANGMLWVAHFGGSRVNRWDPNTGQILDTIELPASQITACAFGDKDLDTLYITSATQGFDDAALEREPYAGGLFSVKPGVQGVVAHGFAG
jgi:sugar lactone lactonase YvrE